MFGRRTLARARASARGDLRLSSLDRRPERVLAPPITGDPCGPHVPILVRRASDVLGPYVGETEQNLRDMFEQATRERALLLVDEADSFIRDRGRAMQSWEVTQVNELLVQMECFEGLFVCTTNLMNELDEASLRRFTLKIRFDALDSEQRQRLFDATLASLGVDGQNESAASTTRSALERLDRLTPGDFAVVARKLTLLSGDATREVSARTLLDELRRECEAKRGATRALGFSV